MSEMAVVSPASTSQVNGWTLSDGVTCFLSALVEHAVRRKLGSESGGAIASGGQPGAAGGAIRGEGADDDVTAG